MNKHRTALILFAVALGVVVVIASVTTLEQVNTQKVSNDAAPALRGLRSRTHNSTAHPANQY